MKRFVFSLIFLLIAIEVTAVPKPLVSPENCDFLRGKCTKLCVPNYAVANDSIEVQSIGNQQRFCDWSVAEDSETYDFLRKVAIAWENNNYSKDYLIYGSTSPNLRSEMFAWEIVPYEKGGWNHLKMLSVMWKISFGVNALEPHEKNAHATRIKKHFDLKHTKPPLALTNGNQKKSDDPFCDPKVIAKQCLYEGKNVTVLYDYAPMKIVDENPHFLIVTKNHKEKFTELSRAEFLESMDVARKVSTYFQEVYPRCTVHMYSKTGKEAGQTVPHFHLHLVVVKDDAYLPSFQFPCAKTPTSCTSLGSPIRSLNKSFGQLCQGCKNFIWLMLPRRKLSDEEIALRVENYKVIFNP